MGSKVTVKPLSLDRISGVLILSAIVLALVAANSPLKELYKVIHHAPIRIGLAPYQIDEPLIVWINQGLMTIFFVLVGVEIKHELVDGHLSTLRRAALPAIAAFGGMVVPALIYVAFTAPEGEAMRGWAIPMATDIALALALLSLLGRRIPVGLKIFLMALAIFDDLGAVAIIAVFYGGEIQFLPMILAFVTFGVMIGLNRLGQAHPLALAVLGAMLWVALFEAGVEAALAGVLIAAVIPNGIKDDRGNSPLLTTHRMLHPWASLLIVPLFGFFNAGVTIEIETLRNVSSGVSMGVFFGLFLGKQIGVLGATWCAVKLGICLLPPGIRFRHIYGAGLLAGVGFTMGLFVTALAFDTPTFAASARLVILVGSSLSAFVGLAVLWFAQGEPEMQRSRHQSGGT
ncbi:Na+/H+ antiporter NhaA [Pelagivirga sediminicola]|uniref:Na(+)/H(+) antiporter NhaA n=1 Tax=Pelagivirga sediminicola TaxID=2170575 RepID=A0A2T7G3G3_9RHOB|nr:Na+/H+ antiporter NhaA [Pelagivirga sediminicola]